MFFIAAEVAFRLAPTSFFVTMDEHDYDESEILDYDAVNLAVELMPAADVIVTGTSRAREAVHGPKLRKLLAVDLGHEVSARNYAIAGGRIDVSLALLERLIAENKLPRVLIVAIDASALRDTEPVGHRLRFATLRSVSGDIERNGWPGERGMTHVFGNSLPLRMALARSTVRYRLVHGGHMNATAAMDGNAAFGGPTAWARLYDERAIKLSLKVKRATYRRVTRVANSHHVEARPLEGLRRLVSMARAHGVAVVLCEIPVAPPVRAAFPNVDTARAVLRRELAALAELDGVWAWTSETKEDRFGKAEFFDPSHLNLRGAVRFTRYIAPVVATALRSAGSRREVR